MINYYQCEALTECFHQWWNGGSRKLFWITKC